MSTVREDTIHGVKWTAIESFVNTVVGLALGIVLARLLTPTDYGIVGMTGIFISLSVLFIDCGFGIALIQKKNPTDADRSTVFFFNVGMAIFFYVVLFIAAPWIADFLNTPVLTGIIRVIGLSLVVGAAGGVQYNLLSKAIDFKSQSIISITGNVLQGIIGIIMAFNGYGPWAIVIPSLFSTAYGTVCVWIRSPWRPKLIFSKQSFKEMFSFGGNMTLNSLLDKIYGDGTGFLIGKFYTPKQLGYFSKGASTAATPTKFITAILGKVLFPIMSKIQDDEQYLIHVYSRYMQITSMVIFFGIMLLIALGRSFTVFLYSDKWLPSVIFMQILCLSYLTSHLTYVNESLLLARKRSDMYLKKEVVNKIIRFTTWIIGVSISVTAICWAAVIAEAFTLFVNTYVTGKVIDYGLRRQAADFLPYLLKAFIFCIPAFLISLLPLPSGVILFGGGIVSTSLYVAYLYKSGDKNFLDLMGLVPWHKFVPQAVISKFGKRQ